ncbi:MAG: hypothetical protein LBK23_11485 [Oscillospiraceae bacterium]|jgi:hypothetical protein|nr:hypothetical protein [Oscillospiraceae bacterium]
MDEKILAEKAAEKRREYKRVWNARNRDKCRNARYLWSKIRGIQSISKYDLTRKTHSKQGFNLDDSITALIERGYICVKYTQTGGRPSPRVIVNPETENIVLKVRKPPESTPFSTFHTTNAVILNTAASEFTDVTGVEDESFPFADVPASADTQQDRLSLEDDF